MCPLRIILIFISATLAGFFLIRNLNDINKSSMPNPQNDDVEETQPINALSFKSKVCTAVGKGFWTCIDMASGRYLWRNLSSSKS